MKTELPPEVLDALRDSYFAVVDAEVKGKLIKVLAAHGEPIEYEWKSTPAQWMAYREGMDGAPDSRQVYGLGRTQEDALRELIEREAES